MSPVIEAIGLSKRRGARCVLEDIHLAVQSGEIVGLLGANGAGKSTLLAIMAGLLRPDAGVVHYHGQDLVTMGAQARAQFGVALQRPSLSPRLTVREVLAFFALCYDGDRPLEDLLASFRLTDKQHTQIRRLSIGEQQRVWVALAFLKRFEVLLLDEPSAALDPAGRQHLWEEMQCARARGAAILFTTHLLDEAQHLSDRLCLLQGGRQLALGSLAELQTQELLPALAHESLSCADMLRPHTGARRVS